jgi:hypothetical protein
VILAIKWASFFDEHPNAVESVGTIEKVKTPKSKKKIVLKSTQRKSLNNSKEQSGKKPKKSPQQKSNEKKTLPKKDSIAITSEKSVSEAFNTKIDSSVDDSRNEKSSPVTPEVVKTNTTKTCPLTKFFTKTLKPSVTPIANNDVEVISVNNIKNLEPDWNYRLFIKIRYNNYKVAEEQLFKDPGLVRMKENLKGVDYFRRSVVDHFRKFKFELSDDQLMKIFDDSNSLGLLEAKEESSDEDMEKVIEPLSNQIKKDCCYHQKSSSIDHQTARI